MLVVVAGVVIRQGRVMLCQRRAEVHNGLKWEFPGGKIEPGESPEQALARELREELAVDVSVGRAQDVVFHRYPDRDVLLLFYRCALTRGEPRAVDCNAVAWATADEVPAYDFAGADRTFAARQDWPALLS